MKTLTQPTTLEVRVHETIVVRDVVAKKYIRILPKFPMLTNLVTFFQTAVRLLPQQLVHGVTSFARPPTPKNINVGPFLAFNDQWFKKHQVTLVFFLNNFFFRHLARYILRINGKRSSIGSKDVCEIMPSFIVWREPGFGRFSLEARTHPKFAKRLYYSFWPMWWLMHFWDWAFADWAKPEWSFGFSSLTAYPDAGSPGTDTCDGILKRQSVDEAFSTIRGGAGNAVANTGTNDDGPELNASATSNQYAKLTRAGYGFLTSAIGSGATVSAVTTSFYGTSKFSDFSTNPDSTLCGFTPATNNVYVNGDFSQVGSTRFASDISYASWSTSGYNDYAENASGIADINKTGVTNRARRLHWDFDNSAPTWGSNKDAYVSAYLADQGGTSNDPKMVVTYDSPLTISVSDAITVSESITMFVDTNINVSDAVTVTENVQIELNSDISVSDAITVSESITMFVDLNPSVFDAITVTESVTVENTELGDISVSDDITVSESVSAEYVAFEISVGEDITITESVSAMSDNNPSVFDSVTITESVSLVIPAAPRGLVRLRSTQQNYPLAMDDSEIL